MSLVLWVAGNARTNKAVALIVVVSPGGLSVSDGLVGLTVPHRTNRTETVTDYSHSRGGTGSGLSNRTNSTSVGEIEA